MAFLVAVTEDNLISRNAFVRKMETSGEMLIAFVASSGKECLQQLDGLTKQKIPQVIFMDLEMEGMDGIDTIRLAKPKYPDIHFIILTVFDDEEKIFEAIKAGASGYLLKHEPAPVLQDAVRNVLEYGGAPMSPAIARKALQMMSLASRGAAAPEKQPLPAIITSREEEILKLMVSGQDAKVISQELSISVLTVRKHISNIYEKLHVNSLGQAINLAHKNKWV